jgi:hypothetical protein
MNRATGEMIANSVGSDKAVTLRNTSIVWPLLVMRSSSRRAWVIQITAVRPSRQARNAPSAMRRM